MASKFIGFSTVNKLFPPFNLTDIELVKQDILNEFNTRIGERVMQPEFGTVIFDLIMNPADEVTLDAIKKDAIRIVQKEPRVTLEKVRVDDFEDAVVIDITLYWAPERLRESLFIRYQRSAGLSNKPRILESGQDATDILTG